MFQRFSGPLSHKAGAYEQTHTKGPWSPGEAAGDLRCPLPWLMLVHPLWEGSPPSTERPLSPLHPPFPAVVIACKSTVHILTRASPWVRLRSPVLLVLVCMYVCLVLSHLHIEGLCIHHHSHGTDQFSHHEENHSCCL